MKYLATPDVCRLTGLSTEKIREWTCRRSLIPADVPSKQQGSAARFSWSTVLVLRLAVVLRERFNVELKANVALFAALRADLARRPFLSLRGQALAILGSGQWRLIDDADLPAQDALVIRLDPHLALIAEGFPQPARARGPVQRDMFPLSGVNAGSRSGKDAGRGESDAAPERRQSA